MPHNCFDAMEGGLINLAMGGGRQHFLPTVVTDDEGRAGSRTDGRNVIEEITARGGQHVWTDEGFAALEADKGPVPGLLKASHLQDKHDRTGEPRWPR